MGRTVNVEMPDGTVLPVEDVPEKYSDESIGKRYGGRVMPRGEDVTRSALSGIPYGLTNLMTAPMKAGIGLGMQAGFTDELAPFARTVNENERRMLEATGGSYQPRTTAGGYAKPAVAAALPIPGMGPAGLQAGLGAASGVLGHGASEAGLGPVGSTLASMLPYAGYGGAKGLQQVQPGRNTRQAINSMLPEELATMQQRMLDAERHKLPLMPWQAAPEGSPVRVLGEKVAGSYSSTPIREIQGKQALSITGNPDLTPPVGPATARISSPVYRESAKVSITPNQVAEIRQSILDMKNELNIPPGSAKAKIFDSMADSFGRYEKAAPQTIIDEVTKQISGLPRNDPARIAAQDRLKRIYAGEVPTVFVPNEITNYGHIQSLYQDVAPKNLDAGMNVDKFTKLKVREAIARVADKYNPLFPEARSTHADLKAIENAVANTDRRTSGGVNLAAEAKTELAPDLALAAGANPVWAAVPWLREKMAKASVRKYNKAFGSTDFEDMRNLAFTDPRQQALQAAGGGLLQPFKQGLVGELPEADVGGSDFSKDTEKRLKALYGLLRLE